MVDAKQFLKIGKKLYVAPEIIICRFTMKDSILTVSSASGGDHGEIESGGDIGWGEEDD